MRPLVFVLLLPFACQAQSVKLPFGVEVTPDRLNFFLADAVGSVLIVRARKHEDASPKIGAAFVIAVTVGGGYAATSRHLVAGADTVSVTFPGGEPFRCLVDFESKETDLAILKIETARRLRPIYLFPGVPLQGDDVVSIGHPHGYFSTVTKGSISAVGRRVELPSAVLSAAIQHTAAIAEGNSGGPLLNRYWQAVGMNAAYHTSGQSMAFAVDSATILSVLPRKYNLPSRQEALAGSYDPSSPPPAFAKAPVFVPVAAVPSYAEPPQPVKAKKQKIKKTLPAPARAPPPMPLAYPDPMTRAED